MPIKQKTDLYPEDGALISRFSIAILSCILFGLGVGSTLPIQGGPVALVAGALGLIYFMTSEYLNKALYVQQANVVRERSERRLSEQLSSPSLDIVEHVA